MKRFALICGLVGLFVLVLLSFFLRPVSISDGKELSELEEGKLVYVTGTLIRMRAIDADTRILTLDKNISVVCTGCSEIHLKDRISVYGRVSTYNERIEIEALRIYLNSESKK